MTDAPATSPALLLAMTAVTGVVDAVSFLALGHVFTANMTGNIVLLGFAFAGAGGVSISRSSLALVAFLSGAVACGRVTRNVSGYRWVAGALVAEALLFAISAGAALLSPLQPYIVVASTAVAMGLRNAVVRKLAVPDITTTVLTLTITGLAADSSIAGGDNPRWQRRVGAILAMIAGAFAGARMVTRSISLPLATCSVITAGCAIAHLQIDSKRREP